MAKRDRKKRKKKTEDVADAKPKRVRKKRKKSATAGNSVNNESMNEALSALEKETGVNISFASEHERASNIDVISSGSILLDYIIGCGGLPRGRIVEIYGPESGGKSTLALLAIAQAQKKDLRAMYVDLEHGLDSKFAEGIGVDTKKLAYTSPPYAEKAFDLISAGIRKQMLDIIVVDSVGALVPRVEKEESMENSQVGLAARIIGKGLRKVCDDVSLSNCLLIFINQTRLKIGVRFGDPETTPGGKALPFFASVRLRVSIRKKTFKKNKKGRVIGHTAHIKVQKNKVGPPHGEAEFDIYPGHGVDRAAEVFELGKLTEILYKSGKKKDTGNTWFIKSGDEPDKENDEKLAGSEEEAKKAIKKDKDLRKRLLKRIKKLL